MNWEIIVEFVKTHWVTIASVLAVVLFVALVIILWVKGKKGIIYKMLYNFVTEAEKQYGGGTGSIKFAQVMTQIYEKLPAVIRLFVTYNQLTKWIEKALADAKKHWGEKAGILQESAGDDGENHTVNTNE